MQTSDGAAYMGSDPIARGGKGISKHFSNHIRLPLRTSALPTELALPPGSVSLSNQSANPGNLIANNVTINSKLETY